MKWIGGFISAAMVVFLAYYLNLRSPDLAYQLSSPITLETPVAGAPSVIEKIEEYDTVFAPGNLLNLRRLAERLRLPPQIGV